MTHQFLIIQYKLFNKTMSKTLQDYRNIVKILKYKLIKLRQENEELQSKIGSTQQQKSSSYKQKLKKYQTKNYIIAKNIVLFLTLADRCQIIGISPQMIYRIADQKRQKKVSKQKFTQILKRIKLKIDQTMMYQLCAYIDFNRDNFIQYQNYMKCLCAFQINTQKYPLKNPRSFTQISLIKFSKHCEKQSRNLDQVFSKINSKKQNQLSFQDFYSYGRKNIVSMNEIQLTAVFIALDIDQSCFIDKNNFIRQVNRAKNSQQLRDQDDSKQPKGQKGRKPRIQDNTQIKKPKKQEFNEQIQTGVEAKNASKPKDKEQPKEIKKISNQTAKALNILRSNKLTIQLLYTKLLDESIQKLKLRSFSYLDFYQASSNISKTVKKSDLQIIFKQIDIRNNGSLDNYQLLKFWLVARQRNQSILILFRILKKQLLCKKIELSDYFKSLNISQDTMLSQDIFIKLFRSLQLDKQQTKQVLSLIGKIKINQFIKKIQSNQQQKKQIAIFKKVDRNKTDIFDNIIKKIKPQFEDQDYYIKLNRQSKNLQRWKTIFTNQWACWKWCYQTIKSLTSFWRDPQFGPNDNDKFGYNSIVGNLNQPPIGIPSQQQIQWVNHFELIKRKNQGKVNFYDQSIKSGSIDQGSIGNCWFISAVSIITQNQKNIKGQKLQNITGNIQNITKGVIPQLFAGFRNYGIYVFKFLKNYKAAYVVVDDLIPVQLGNSDPLFAHSHELGIQWPSLIQKAYAKLHHTYSALISGDIAQGLSDLTGCLPIKQAVDKKLQQESWKKLFNYQNTKQLMGCSISPPPKTAIQKPVQLDGQNCGLVYGHAYSISDIFQIQDKKSQQQFKLLRIRNPWGQGQWVLEWSQNPRDGDPQNDKLKKYSKQIQQYYNKKIKQAKQKRQQQVEGYDIKQDGIFLMSFYDWINVYTSLFVGLNLSEKYTGKSIKDMWTQQFPSGIVSPSKASKAEKQNFVKKNFQYRLNLTQDTDILIILSQIDGRLFKGEKYPYPQICNPCIILVFKINDKDGSLKSFEKQLMYSQSFKIQNRREITFWKKFQKGTYIIIPVTTNYTNNQFEDKYPEFQLAVYFDCDQKNINLKKIGSDKQFKLIQKNQKTANKNQKQIQQLVKKLVQMKNNL